MAIPFERNVVQADHQKGEEMEPKELLERMKRNKGPVIVDVRTGLEFRRGHICGAHHAPTWKIFLGLAKLPADRGTELVVTCEHGPRAQITQKILHSRGYHNVTLLSGHMAGWRRSGMPVVK
ncbi:rhodanese-like domain-containing protein [Geomonas paludis]|nr:rhodanese-like domain-containing protein [Geomonas paludis]